MVIVLVWYRPKLRDIMAGVKQAMGQGGRMPPLKFRCMGRD